MALASLFGAGFSIFNPSRLGPTFWGVGVGAIVLGAKFNFDLSPGKKRKHYLKP